MAKTIKELAAKRGIQPASIQKKFKRKGWGSYGVDDILPDDVLKLFLDNEKEAPTKPPIDESKPVEAKPKKKKENKILKIIPFLPLPMLGLAASYGVYFFAINFVPFPFALIEASAFEFVYIGLACLPRLDKKLRKRALLISLGAVLISAAYNTMAAAIHMDACLLQDLKPAYFWGISLLHGVPLAVLSFGMADLIIHKK